MPIPYNPTTVQGRVAAVNNQLLILKTLRLFGHLRRQELAMAVWPKSSRKSAYIMACRTVTALLNQGLILERINTLGGKSLVLAAKGVARLKDLDLRAQEGYDLAFDGPQFFHRTLGSAYLIEKARKGFEVFGEYALLKGYGIVSKQEFKDRYQKIPDGMIAYAKGEFGLKASIRPADWVEVESAYKPYDELRKVLSVLTKTTSLNKEGTAVLHKLIFVFDARQRHEKQILRAINQFLKENPHLDPELFLEEIIFAKCYIDPPFTWHGFAEVTAAELWKDPDNAYLFAQPYDDEEV